MQPDDKPVVLTPQIQADLRLAWNLLEDAGHHGAAERVFNLLEQRAPVPAVNPTEL